MGEKNVERLETHQRRQFLRSLLNDLDALQRLLDEGLLDDDTPHIGAEQELCLVDRSCNPAPLAMAILDDLDDPRYTTELARFNLEFNLAPLRFRSDCLASMEQRLARALSEISHSARKFDADCLLVGILPTISRRHLGLDNMTPEPRFTTLNDAFCSLRNEPYDIHIKGHDELRVKHDSVMMEACNTSFQVHLQIRPGDLVASYNWAQAIAAPILAAATNSPLLLGRRLWKETRIALFQQSTDTRCISSSNREMSPRVTFGRQWVRNSILEIFQDDIARYRAVSGRIETQDSLAMVEKGEIPSLSSLCEYNSTIYRWNRPCYGITDGKPHLRIENRIFPSGPTVVDEVANAAMWLGVMNALPDCYRDIRSIMDFDDARRNFYNAARVGLEAQLRWTHGKEISARDLMLEELIPLAKEGLTRAEVDAADIARYIGIIDDRVRSGRTGSQWMMDSITSLRSQAARCETPGLLTSGLMARQEKGIPVHQWAPIDAHGCRDQCRACVVEQIMTTDLFVAREDDPIEVAIKVMAWKKVRHILVEDDLGSLSGLVTSGMLTEHAERPRKESVALRDVMTRQPLTVPPSTSIGEAAALMKRSGIDSLPIVENDKVIGIVTERDLSRISSRVSKASGRRKQRSSPERSPDNPQAS